MIFYALNKFRGQFQSSAAVRTSNGGLSPKGHLNFGGLWESAVKSTELHLSCVVGSVKLTFEEFCTILTQVEACLNSRLLTPVNVADDDGIQVLTPGHFFISKPLAALPDPSFSYRSVSVRMLAPLSELTSSFSAGMV